MIKLTAPDGHPVWIFPSWVQMVRSPRPSEFTGTNAKTVVVLSGINQAVRESVDEVAAALAVSADR